LLSDLAVFESSLPKQFARERADLPPESHTLLMQGHLRDGACVAGESKVSKMVEFDGVALSIGNVKIPT
jgi:hypothetical protein